MEPNNDNVQMIKSLWGNLRVPIRPGSECLDIYRAFMEKLPRKDILVLGATPELVDMAVELKAEKITSIERNPDIIEAMKQLGNRDWSGVELHHPELSDHR